MNRKKSGMSPSGIFLLVVGGVMLLLLSVLSIREIPSLIRYMKIKSM